MDIFIKKTMKNKILLLISLIFIILFTWYGIRPSIIKHKCAKSELSVFTWDIDDYQACLSLNGI